MKAPATSGIRVQFRTASAGSTPLEGTSVMLDLSEHGCRLSEPLVPLRPGIMLELRIHAPGQDRPLTIERARIQWGRDHVFGLSFLVVSELERQRLEEVIEGLVEDKGS